MKTHHVDTAHEHEYVAVKDVVLPRAGPLLTSALETGKGIDIRSLKIGTTLLVQTHDTHYRMAVLNPARLLVLVTGGEFFRHETEARLNGAMTGGSTLKTGWIGVRSPMDLRAGGRRIVTSPVRSITIESVQ